MKSYKQLAQYEIQKSRKNPGRSNKQKYLDQRQDTWDGFRPAVLSTKRDKSLKRSRQKQETKKMLEEYL